ncbi:MAG: GNAT family N-acetyltransferase [Promethearchaeota archaeon]
MKLLIDFINQNLKKQLKYKLNSSLKDLTIVETKTDDAYSVLNIHSSCFNNLNYSREVLNLKKIQNFYNFPGTRIYIAKHKGNDIGYIILELEGPTGEYGIISSVGVLPKYQRKGVGTSLILKAFLYFEQNNVIQILSEISLLNYAGYNFLKSVNFEDFQLIFEMD